MKGRGEQEGEEGERKGQEGVLLEVACKYACKHLVALHPAGVWCGGWMKGGRACACALAVPPTTVNTHYYVKSRVRRLRTSMVLCMSLRSFLTQSLPVLHHPPAPKSPPTPAPLLIHTPTITSQAGTWLPASTDPPHQPPLHPHPCPVAPPPCPLTPLPLLSHLRSTFGLLPHTSRLARGFRQLRPHTCVEPGRLLCRPQLAGVGQGPLDQPGKVQGEPGLWLCAQA